LEVLDEGGQRRFIFYHFWSSETLVWIRIQSDSPKSLDPDPDTSKSTVNDPDTDAMKYRMNMTRINDLTYPEAK
jgi:hypothetical protein